MGNAFYALEKKRESLVYFETSFAICASDIIESKCVQLRCELGIQQEMPKRQLSKLVYLQHYPDNKEIERLDMINGSVAYLKSTQLTGIAKTKALMRAMSDSMHTMQVKDELGMQFNCTFLDCLEKMCIEVEVEIGDVNE